MINEDHLLVNSIPIPTNTDGTPDSSRTLSQREQLELHQIRQRNERNNSRSSIFDSPPTASISSRSSRGLSDSSISNTTNGTVSSSDRYGQNGMSNILDVCNEIDTADECIATTALVKKCIRDEIWTTNKFLSDLSIKAMKIENKTNPNTLLNILLRYTRKGSLSNLDRLKFWKKYSGDVQQGLNSLKTMCTRSIKEEVMIGESYLY